MDKKLQFFCSPQLTGLQLVLRVFSSSFILDDFQNGEEPGDEGFSKMVDGRKPKCMSKLLWLYVLYHSYIQYIELEEDKELISWFQNDFRSFPAVLL